MKNVIFIIAIAVLAYGTLLSDQHDYKFTGTPDDQISNRITDDSLLNLTEYRTFRYFWDGAEPVSGMAPERIHIDGEYPDNDMNIVTTGGSGFGVMVILAGIKRGYISREEGYERLLKIVGFLEKADRFHGAWPHWLNGETGKVKPFGMKDNGADIVETAFLMQGLLTVRQYFESGSERESELAAAIDRLWRSVEWSWFTRGGQNVLYWHWSPDYKWEMNMPVQGYDECLILYVLAASSPTYPIRAEAYHEGWARGGKIRTHAGKYGYVLTLRHNGAEEYGGPLFWSQYSFLGLDPRNLQDQYANYWEHNTNHTLINWKWCSLNPLKYKGYGANSWGLTASYSVKFYAAHAPGEKTDLGVISPTAAISSFPYTPEHSMAALKHFYYDLGDRIWGEYGFYDAFSEEYGFYPQRYLAIDQGPQVVMIENYRSGMFWDLFMSCPEVHKGLKLLGFTW
ncbi:MAG TPA: glucoamylase family protein [Bacteroidales bacterium]|nr:glucoamylase family protein [Bacteroidales bacterium]